MLVSDIDLKVLHLSFEARSTLEDSGTRQLMADFYVLPPRPVVGEQLAKVLRAYLPGLPITPTEALRFLEETAARSGQEAFVIHREDLPDGEEVCTALRDGYGCTEGDRIMQVSLEPTLEEPRLRLLVPHREQRKAG